MKYIKDLDIGKIKLNSAQPRHDLGDLTGLVETISRYGIIEPLIVADQDDGTYALLAGERRFRASKEAGLKTVPAIIRSGTEDPAIVALIENLQRKQLTPLEEGAAYKALLDSGETQKGLAEKLGVSRDTIAQRVRLLSLPSEARLALVRGWITESAARQLLRLAVVDAMASEPPAFGESWANTIAHRILWHRLRCLDGEATTVAVGNEVDYVFAEMVEVQAIYGMMSADEAEEKARKVITSIGSPTGTRTSDPADAVQARLAITFLRLRPDWTKLTEAQRREIEKSSARWLGGER